MPTPECDLFRTTSSVLRSSTTTYGHIYETIRDPVRSPLVKLVRAKSVLRSVTTGESLVLYVFCFLHGLHPLFQGFLHPVTTTYDHRHQEIRDPVRSPRDKLATAGLVLRSVTTGESPVLYVFACCVRWVCPVFMSAVNTPHEETAVRLQGLLRGSSIGSV